MDDEKTTLQLITSSVTSLLNVKRSIIFLYDKTENLLLAKEMSGLDISEFSDNIKIRPGEGIIGKKVFMEKKSMLIKDAFADNLTIKRIIERLDIKSFLAVPLLDNDKAIGVLYADTKLDGSGFVEDDLKLLSIFASFASISIKNAQLIKSLRSEVKVIKNI